MMVDSLSAAVRGAITEYAERIERKLGAAVEQIEAAGKAGVTSAAAQDLLESAVEDITSAAELIKVGLGEKIEAAGTGTYSSAHEGLDR